MNTKLHFSCNRQDWATPWAFFKEQEAKYGPFDLDVCALPHNAKCATFFTPEDDALSRPWPGVCWMNPPYGRGLTALWVAKAFNEVKIARNAARVVCLLPASTSNGWWHDFIRPHVPNPDFIRGRIRFEGAANSAPFSSAIVVFEQ